MTVGGAGGGRQLAGLVFVVIACGTMRRLRQSQMAAENGQQQAVEGIGQARVRLCGYRPLRRKNRPLSRPVGCEIISCYAMI